jgi:hypothetical protein
MLPAFLAFLANPAFWKGVAEAGGTLLSSMGSKAGGEGEAQAPAATGLKAFQASKPPISLMGFPSMQNKNYGDIIKLMLGKQKLLS